GLLRMIGEEGDSERGRRLQPRHFEKRAVRAGKLGLDEAARVGGGVEEITGCAATRAEAETIERNEGGHRIAGHRVPSRLSLSICGALVCAGAIDLRATILPVAMNPT